MGATVYFYCMKLYEISVCACVCMCVCVREREGEGERERGLNKIWWCEKKKAILKIKLICFTMKIASSEIKFY